MKKSTYKIRINHEGSVTTDTRQGYVFEVCGYVFGVTRFVQFENDTAPYKGRVWIVSELQTGYKLAEVDRLKDAPGVALRLLHENADTINRAIFYAEERFGVINKELIREQKQPLKKAFTELYSIEDAGMLKAFNFTLSDLEVAKAVFNVLKERGHATTFCLNVGAFFKRCGLDVRPDLGSGLYKITA